MDIKQNFLITGVGAPGTQGTLRCLKSPGVKFIGVDMNPQCAGSHFVDHFYPVPGPEDKNYLGAIAALCHQHDVSLIIPQTTREIEVLSANFRDLKVMVSPYAALKKANDKLAMIKIFEELGFPVPKYRLATSKEMLVEAAHDLGYPEKPVAIKPPKSNGMRGFRILQSSCLTSKRFLSEKPSGIEISLDHMLEILENGKDWPQLLVTEYLPGDEYSVDAFIGGKASIAIVRKRDLIRSGISFRTTPINHPLMEKMTLDAGKYLGLRYVFGMQYKLDSEGVPKILECNPRVQGTMAATLNTGINLIWAGVLEALGSPVASFPKPKFGLPFERYWGGVIFDDGKVQTL